MVFASWFAQKVFFFAPFFLIACSTTPVYKLYDGIDRNSSEIAVLKNSFSLLDTSIYIDSVDGISPNDASAIKSFYGSKLTGNFRIELLPGKHVVSVRYGYQGTSVGSFTVEDAILNFEAKAGKTYYPRVSLDKTIMRGVIWLEEV